MKKQSVFNPVFIYSVILLCFFSCISAQEKKDIYSSSIWIKGVNPPESGINDENLSRENELAKYFNFNPGIDFTKDKIQKKFKGVIEKSSSLFIVFKSDGKDPVDLFSLKNGSSLTTVSNQKIFGDNDIVYHKGDVKKGIIVSYLYAKNSILSKKKGTLSFNESLFSNSGNNNVLELIYIPRILNEKEQNKVESYLSIKYGISLLGEKDYYDSNYQKIWDYKTNADYNKRVTAIGRDDAFALYQKQSGNHQKDGLYFGITKLAATNSANKSIIDDGTFWIWGDNDKSTLIKKDAQDMNSVRKMERVWKMQAIRPNLSRNPSLQLVLNKKEFQTGITKTTTGNSDEIIWMAIDTTGNSGFDYKKAVYIPSKDLNDGTLIFDKLVWKSNGANLFTFVQAPDLLVTTDYLSPDCNLSQNGNLQINLFGGKAPYHVKIHSDTYARTLDVAASTVTIPNLTSGKYTLEVFDDSRHTYTTDIIISTFEATPVSLNPEWFLDSSKEVLVTPLIKNDKDIAAYEWYKANDIVSQGKQFTGKEAGDYKLMVTNSKGCKETFHFSIVDKSITTPDQWVVFPNPVASGAVFSVSFDFQKATKTTVSIYDLGGKLLQFKDLGAITSLQYKNTLTVSGTYMIVCSIDGTLETSKLIVK
jgi:hypothetical protein